MMVVGRRLSDVGGLVGDGSGLSPFRCWWTLVGDGSGPSPFVDGGVC